MAVARLNGEALVELDVGDGDDAVRADGTTQRDDTFGDDARPGMALEARDDAAAGRVEPGPPLDSSAERIGELYKERWLMQLFFRSIKQHLKIERFLGTSENAVRIQIAVALIAYLILRMAHTARAFPATLLGFARLVRTNLMHGKTTLRFSSPTTAHAPMPNTDATPPLLNRTAVGQAQE